MCKRGVERLFALLLILSLTSSVTACGLQGYRFNDGAVSSDNRGGVSEDEGQNGTLAGQMEPQESSEENGGAGKEDMKQMSADGWQKFFKDSFYHVLSDAGYTNTNRIYSPVNLYLCLAMLSEISGGDTRKQITNLLGQEDQKKIRKQSEALHLEADRVLTCRVGEVDAEYDYRSALGNSLWLKEGYPFQQKRIKQLERFYHADCYQGEMGTAEMDKEIQRWIDRMTGGKLKGQTGGGHTTPNTVMKLLSTINFESAWKNHFSKEETRKGVFHVYHGVSDAEGSDSKNKKAGDITCDFLHQSIDTMVMKGTRYMAVKLPMQNGVSMYIVLPNRGVALEEVVEQERKEGNLLPFCTGDNDNAEYANVDFSMPKFDIDSTFELREILESMGVTDMFQDTKADFSPLIGKEHDCETAGIYVEQASQTSNMTVDENGCSVASYTEMGLESKGLSPDKRYEIHCDRPFLFMITKENREDNAAGMPLFTGVIERIR